MDKEFIAAWKKWRKRNLDGWAYQLLVLFKIIKSPTLEMQRACHVHQSQVQAAWAAHSMVREAREGSEE